MVPEETQRSTDRDNDSSNQANSKGGVASGELHYGRRGGLRAAAGIVARRGREWDRAALPGKMLSHTHTRGRLTGTLLDVC